MIKEFKDFLLKGNIVRSRREPIEEGMPDEERRHQELLAALRASTSRP